MLLLEKFDLDVEHCASSRGQPDCHSSSFIESILPHLLLLSAHKTLLPPNLAHFMSVQLISVSSAFRPPSAAEIHNTLLHLRVVNQHVFLGMRSAMAIAELSPIIATVLLTVLPASARLGLSTSSGLQVWELCTSSYLIRTIPNVPVFFPSMYSSVDPS
jgi:hypothetical protein